MPYSFNPFTGNLDYYQAGSSAASVYSNGNSGSSFTVNWSNGAAQSLTLTANCNLSFSNPPAAGTVLILQLTQDLTGSRSVSQWPAPVVWPSQTSVTLTTTAKHVDTVTLFYDGTSYYASYTLDYIPYNPNWDPTALSGLQMWIDANDLATLTLDGSNKVSSWLDKSGNANHATQATSGAQPIWTANAVTTGKNGVDFDGANQFMDFATAAAGAFMDPANPCSLYFVFKKKTSEPNPYGRMLLCKDSSSTTAKTYAFVISSALSPTFQANANSGSWTGLKFAVTEGSWHKLLYQYNGSGGGTLGNFSGQLDAVVQSNSAAGANGTGGSANRLCGDFGGSYAYITLSQLFIVNRTLTSQEITSASAWSNSYAGV